MSRIVRAADLASFASQRPTLVDNNTWNNTHIATVGKAMSSPEDKALPILRQHDVDYILIIFGGLLGYSGDDINKFLWMIRISQGIWPDEIKEADFFTANGQFKIDDEASKTMRESLMYKMSYYRFNELYGGRPGMDRVRGTAAATTGPTLDVLDEAFTSCNWIVSRASRSLIACASAHVSPPAGAHLPSQAGRPIRPRSALGQRL